MYEKQIFKILWVYAVDNFYDNVLFTESADDKNIRIDNESKENTTIFTRTPLLHIYS
jgi:hypothetical protein